MRWSLPPSWHYAEDRLSFGESSWKTSHLLVSTWVKTLFTSIARIVPGKRVTVKCSPEQICMNCLQHARRQPSRWKLVVERISWYVESLDEDESGQHVITTTCLDVLTATLHS